MPRSRSSYSDSSSVSKPAPKNKSKSQSKVACTPCPVKARALEENPNYPYKLVAYLSGQQVVPPVTNANRGVVTLWFARDFSHVNYTLWVETSAEVTQAHLHLGLAGENGLAVAFLLNNGPNGTLSTPPASGFEGQTCGTIKGADLINGLAGSTIAALYNALKNQQLYADVHTTNAPAGELRGQFFA